ncbi:MAG: hypothetical protein JEZ07_00855 [Phycisphaerae bacterium]|nr:hypothetical protein [Phycisphaerae bacterium]
MQSAIKSGKFTVLTLLLLMMIFSSTSLAAEQLATWTNANGTNIWSDPTNWDIGAVPVNGFDTYNVDIPTGFTVYFDLDQASFVTDLSLALGSTLVIDPGTSLTVLDDAIVAGKVQTSGANTQFICTSDGATLGNGATISTDGGSTVQFDAAEFSSTALNNQNITLLSVDGYGSRLSLPELLTIDAGFTASYHTHTISATNSGVLDLSWVGTIHSATNSTSSLNIKMASDGYINFYYLTDIVDGYTRFDIDIPVYNFPSLATANKTTFDIPTGTQLQFPELHTFTNGTMSIADDAEIIAPKLTAFTNSSITLNPLRTFITGDMTNIDNSRFTLTDGHQFGTDEIDAIAYASTGVTSSLTLFSVDGTGTLMDLSSLQSFDASNGTSYRTQTLTATSNGSIDLSSVETVKGMSNSTSRLNFHMDSDGLIDLSSLLEIPSGYVNFDINIPEYTLPLLQGTSGTTFDASAVSIINLPALTSFYNGALTIADGGTINAPVLSSLTYSSLNLNPTRTLITSDLTDIDNSRIALTDGIDYGTDIVATSYSAAGLTSSLTLFSTTGDGTVLDLSSLESFNGSNGTSYRTQTVSAISNGKIDLSSVGTVYGMGNSTSRLKFHIDTDADIDLSSLVEIPSGYCTFDINIPDYTLPLLQATHGTTFDASDATTINLPALTDFDRGAIVIADGGTINAPLLKTFTNSTLSLTSETSFLVNGLSNIDNSLIYLSAGAVFGTTEGDSIATSYSATGVSSSTTLLQADGQGTILDLSSLESVNASNGTSYRTQTIAASNNAAIDFTNVGVIYGMTNSTSKLQINLNSAAEIYVGTDLDVHNYTTFNISENDTVFTVDGNLNLNSKTRFFASQGAKVNINGDFQFNINDEASFITDTAIFQFANGDVCSLEVAGADLALAPTSSNFGMAQLIVGSEAQPTKVMLVDLIDNGNRDGKNEALYLFGSGSLSGLRIKPGSKLIIGDIDVYAFIDTEMVHINSLFGPDTKYINYDEGTIALTDFDCTLQSDLNGDCFVNLLDLAIMTSEWLQGGEEEIPE